MPARGAVMLASIFIASMVATTAPASTLAPSSTARLTTPANGAATCPLVGGVRLLGGLDVHRDALVAHLHRSQLATHGEHDGAQAAVVGLGHRLQPDEQPLARLEVDLVLGADVDAVQELAGPQHREVGVGVAGVQEVLGGAGEQQPVEGGPGVGLERLAVLRRQLGVARLDVAPFQGLGAERLGPAAGRVAELTGEEPDDRVGDVVPGRVGLEVVRIGLGADEGQGEVADNLAARGHLDDVAEDAVRRGIHVLDGLEVVAEAQGDGLLAQVGQLSAGDLVRVHPPGGRRQPGLERGVQGTHRLPVRLEVAHRGEVETGRAGRPVGGGDQAGHRGLAGGAGHRGAGHVDGVHARVDRGEQGAELAPGGVVRVQVDRLVEALAQRADEGAGGGGPQQAGHVLDGDDVRAGPGDLVGEAQVVVEGVELLAGVGEVAGVAQRDLGHGGPGVADGVDGRTHLAHVVEGVEDPEDVDAGAGGLVHERVGDLRGVRGVADRVPAPQQHLQGQVRHRLAQLGQALPGVLGQEAQRDVVRRAAPCLDGEQLRSQARDVRRDVQQVAGPDPGGEQGLVGVAEGGLGDGHRLLGAQLLGERLRAVAQQPVPRAGRGRAGQVQGRQLGPRGDGAAPGAVGLVDRDVGEVGEQLGTAVGGHPRGAQFRALVDERGGQPSGLEVRGPPAAPGGTGCSSRRRGCGTRRAPAAPGAPPSGSRGRGR